MLAQDYILKQLTASLMYPEDDFGKEFWDKIYMKAQERFGTVEIPVDTYNKIWILPEEASVYVQGATVYVSSSHLKVMLEEDYLALSNNSLADTSQELIEDNEWREETKQLIREVILPEIEHEVNKGKNFSTLRQIYHSMILATWYKRNLKESLLGQIYVDQNKMEGIDHVEKDIKEKIYNQYVDAFKNGVYDYIKEEYDLISNEVIPRKYFSGGLDGLKDQAVNTDEDPSDDLSQWVKAPHKKVAVEGAILSGQDSKSQLYRKQLSSLPDEIPFEFNKDLTNYTTIKIGARCTAFLKPRTLTELSLVLKFTDDKNIPIYFLGKGSNVLITKYIPGLVISMDDFDEYEIDNNSGIIEAEAGVLLTKLSREASRNGLSGLEFAIGIPGNLGGGVVTAVSYPPEFYRKNLLDNIPDIPLTSDKMPDVNDNIASLIENVTVIYPNGEIQELNADELAFGYRTSLFKNEKVYVYKVKLKLKKRSDFLVNKISDIILTARKSNRKASKVRMGVITRSLGQSFQNNHPSYSDERTAIDLIRVSNVHILEVGSIKQVPGIPGALYNSDGQGTAEQYLRLMDRILNKVKEKTGINLIPEISLMPDESMVSNVLPESRTANEVSDDAEMPGGIDFNPDNMNLTAKGNEINFVIPKLNADNFSIIQGIQPIIRLFV